jgi:hypothetical protein
MKNAQLPKAFDYAPTIDGFEVIDTTTGRPVDHPYDTPSAANGRAWQLNQIVWSGDTRGLARALRGG